MFATPRAPSSTPGSGARPPRSSLLGGRSSATPRMAPASAAKKMRPQQQGRYSSLSSPSPSLSTSLLSHSQHQLLESSGQHSLLKPPNSASPVLVAEILTANDKSSEVSVSMSASGWSWLVRGRRLLVWRHRPPPGSRSMGACRELTLPPSDLAHSASLVNVFAPPAKKADNNQAPACIAVSPEGLIRYWSSIAHESSWVEVSAELQGQECCSLTDAQPVGSILATTTSTVGLVYLPGSRSSASAAPHSGVCFRPFRLPQGLLGGIGRRMSSFLWGGAVGAAAGSEARLVQVLSRTHLGDAEEKAALVLTAAELQKWLLVRDEDDDALVFTADVAQMARDAFINTVWDKSSPGWLKIWLLDMQFGASGCVTVLVAAVNTQVSNQIHYALGTLSFLGDEAPTKFRSFCVLKHTAVWDERGSGDDANSSANGSNSRQLGYRLLLAGAAFAYVYNKDSVMCCSAVVDNDEPDVLDFSSQRNGIVGAGHSAESGTPLLFTLNQGLVAITPTTQAAAAAASSALESSNVSFNESVAAAERASLHLSESLNMSVSRAGIENLTASEAKSDQLKAAFLLFCKRDLSHSLALVEELFPFGERAMAPPASLVDSSLDKLVLAMSEDLIDDFPASDPRWMESVPESESGEPGLPSSSSSTGCATMSLLILHQLEDKQTALEFYINFLQEVGLWRQLSGVTLRDARMPTSAALCEHVEKTAAAISLRQIHNEHQSLVDKAIRLSLRKRKDSMSADGSAISKQLTPQDHFYREISKIEEVVSGLQEAQETAVVSASPQEVVATVMAANKIIVTVIRDALETRRRKTEEFARQRKFHEQQQQQQLQQQQQRKAATPNVSPSRARRGNNKSERDESQDVEFDFLPWTATPGPFGMRTALIKQFRVTNAKALSLSEDSVTRAAFSQQMSDLADLVMDGYRAQMDRLDPNDPRGKARRKSVQAQFERDRAELVMALVEGGFYELAASLAEKYLEFAALVTLCEATGDKSRLDGYMDRFAKQGFADFVFAWHVREGKQAKLLKETSGDRKRELGAFLRQGHAKLSWLHALEEGDYFSAADTLASLAEHETDLLARKKTMLSLSKLSALASDAGDEQDDEDDDTTTAMLAATTNSLLNRVEHQLSVVSAQEQLPRSALASVGMEEEDAQRVLSPREIIELYVGDANANSDHLDFKRALDLLDYVSVSSADAAGDLGELRAHVFARALLRDDWGAMDVDNPLEAVRETVFFRLAEFCYIQGLDLTEVLPDPEALFASPDLRHLRADANFKFLVRCGYEHIHRVQRRNEDEEGDSVME